jgi:hypothetical protein
MNNRNFKYVSMDMIANRIMKHPLLKELNFSDIIDHTVDVLRLANVPGQYVESSCYVTIEEFKAKIPDNNLNVKAVDYMRGETHIPMVIATDGLQGQLHKVSSGRDNSNVPTYSLHGGLIHTNKESGKLFVVYDELKCGEDGIPMIPDSQPLIKAIENYIKVQVFTVLVDIGKVGQGSLQRAEQEYSWYIGKAQTEFQGFINDDDTESFLRDFKRLFIESTNHKERNMYNVSRERRMK